MKDFSEVRKKLLKTYIYPLNPKQYFVECFTKSERYYIYRFLFFLRKYEYLSEINDSSIILKARRLICSRKYHTYAHILGYVIEPGTLGPNVTLYHKGSVVIHGKAKIGANCRIHGDCFIGVSHVGDTECPVIGDNVDIGVGAKILGNIFIASNTVIGANSVVIKSILEEGTVVAGVPATIIKRI